MSDEIDLTGRVRVLEHSVHKLETRMEAGFTDLSKALGRLTDNISSRPVTPPFKEIMASVVATLTVVMIVAGVIGGYVDRSIALSNATASGPQRVIEYRLDKLEKERMLAVK